MSISEKILLLTKQLYPTGRAFKMPSGGWFEKLHIGLAQSEVRAFNDALSIKDSMLPDNNNFSADDATDWERRLGLIYSPLTPLSDRKLAIKRKIQHPGLIKARQHYLYLQGQLRAAGFDVYVYENRFLVSGIWVTKPATDFVFGIGTTQFQHGEARHGQRQHGGTWANKIANHIDEEEDLIFNVGNNLRSTFFIAGSDINNPVTAIASVPLVRKKEFRQLILKLKPVQTVGYLLINYI